MSSKKRVLIISHDRVGRSMAGPGMRYHQIASQLSKHFDTTLAVFNPAYLDDLADVPYQFLDIHIHHFQEEFAKYDVIFALWLSPEMIDFAKQKGIILIFDMYAPGPVEELVSYYFAGKIKPDDEYNYGALLDYTRQFFRAADYIVCSNSIQRDFWNGYAFAAQATSPATYETFPLYDRIGIVPMGIDLDDLKLKTGKDPIRQRLPAIKASDFLLVSTGGIWDWSDAETPIRAIHKIKQAGHDNIKLAFLATKHPNKEVREMNETTHALTLAKKLGLYNKHVFFLEGWIPYKERIDYFAAADAAIYAYKPSIETRYSHRTRVLDHILLQLPTVATGGDYLGSILESEKMGLIVAPRDYDAMAEAIHKLAADSKLRASIKANIAKVQKHYTWQETTKPLVDFINSNPVPRPLITAKPLLKTTRSRDLVKRILPRQLKEMIKRYMY